MQDKWPNTDLDVSMYWPDLLAYHFKMVSAVPVFISVTDYQSFFEACNDCLLSCLKEDHRSYIVRNLCSYEKKA